MPQIPQTGSAFAKATDMSIKTVFLQKDYFGNSPDTAKLNLMCAQGLPGTEDLDIDKYMSTLDKWAEHVKKVTEKNIYKYHKDPADFYNSEAYFKMLLLVCTLQEDFNIKYNPLFKDKTVSQIPAKDSRDMFLHGLLSDKREGTCASMPVLYLAVGRRLGYPLKLVAAKHHIFLRWEDEKERINLEGTGRGLSVESDDYYREWLKFTPEENNFSYFFKSMNPMEEYALFLELRADVMRDNGMYDNAIKIYEKVLEYIPNHPGVKKTIASVISQKAYDKVIAEEGQKADTARKREQSLPLISKAILKMEIDFPNQALRIEEKYRQLTIENPSKNQALYEQKQKEMEKLLNTNSANRNELMKWMAQTQSGNGPPITQAQIDTLMGVNYEESPGIKEMRRINEIEKRRLETSNSRYQNKEVIAAKLSILQNNENLIEFQKRQEQMIQAQNMRLFEEEKLRLQQQGININIPNYGTNPNMNNNQGYNPNANINNNFNKGKR